MQFFSRRVTMRSRQKPSYKSPVFCYTSEWLTTDEIETYLTKDGETKTRLRVILKADINPEWRGTYGTLEQIR